MRKFEFAVGDYVQYTGMTTTRFIGLKGKVVKKVSSDYGTSAIEVIFDGTKSVEELFCENFTKVNTEESEIDKALAVLKKYGKVEFKKNKPPFVNKQVRINSSYNAVVNERNIQVGCQTVAFSVIDELAEAVAIARKYNEEK